MKNSKYVDLFGGGKVLVQEVPVRRILSILPFLKGEKVQEEAKEGEVQKTFADHASELLEDTVGLKTDDLLDLLPSDWEKIWQAFREVNSFFFKMADKMGVTEQVGSILKSVLAGVGTELAISLQTATRAVLITDSVGLSALSSEQGTNAEAE